MLLEIPLLTRGVLNGFRLTRGVLNGFRLTRTVLTEP